MFVISDARHGGGKIPCGVKRPAGDGIQATRAILHQNPRARILALTSDESEANALAAVRAGALGLVRKHASTDELIRTVHSVAAD